MKHLELKGARVPALGFGTFELSGPLCAEMVRYALELGYRHLDTAQVYGNEDLVGKGMRGAGVEREEIFLTTKVWMDQLAYADVKRSTEESLSRLGTEYVDLLLIHWPNPAVPLQETLRALAELREAGKTRFIGVSNFTVALLEETVNTHGADVLCNQVEYHPFLSQRPVLNWLRDHDMLLTAYSPLARGRVLDDPALQRIAGRHGKTPTQVALRWLIEQDNVAAIPKASSREHCKANFEIFDFALSEVDMEEIGRLTGSTRLIDPDWAPDWDGP